MNRSRSCQIGSEKATSGPGSQLCSNRDAIGELTEPLLLWSFQSGLYPKQPKGLVFGGIKYKEGAEAAVHFLFGAFREGCSNEGSDT